MTTEFFRKTNQRRTTLSRVAHLSGLLLLLCPLVGMAQNGVTVSNLAVDAGTVTFNVSWDKNSPVMPEVWSDTVWVFVDYNDAGTMKRLPVEAGATLTATSAPGSATVIQYPGNDKGVWVVGNAKTAASGSFSATVKVQTPKLGVFAGACVYASNYPPVAQYITTDEISFTGTPMYNIVIEDAGGNTEIRKSDSPFSVPAGYTLQSFSDASYAPGTIKCLIPVIYALNSSASGYCEGSSGGTLSLLNTQNGVSYQLYKDGAATSTVLLGNGSAAAFAGTFTAGTYTARTVAGKICEVAMSGTMVITVNPLPDNPSVTISSSFSRCGSGTVTIGASSSDAEIDWYVAASGGISVTTGANYTPDVTTSTTYYAESRYSTTGCVSSSRTPVPATVITGYTEPGATVNFTAFNPCSVAPTGTTWTLQDRREINNPQDYKVKKMADGYIWMVQDMKFGDLCGPTFTGSNGDDLTGRVSSIGNYYGDCSSATISTTPPDKGYFYDWAAAMNLSDAYLGSTTIHDVNGYWKGICPDGWHIPSISEFDIADERFQRYYKCTGINCWDDNSEWSGVFGGSNRAGSLTHQGHNAFYWSKSHRDDGYVYHLYMNINNGYYALHGLSTFQRDYGVSVRCKKQND